MELPTGLLRVRDADSREGPYLEGAPAFMSTDGPKNAREAEWVELFRTTGHNEYFERLYELCRKKVYARCLQLLRNSTEAEDVTHEVFLRAFEKFSSLKGGNFSGWVSKIACNLCLNRIRDGITHRRLLEESQLETKALQPASVERETIQAEYMRIAHGIIQELQPEQRKVLLLKYLEGLSYREIEQITGYDGNQVRSYLQNARRNFQLRWRSQIVADQDVKNGT